MLGEKYVWGVRGRGEAQGRFRFSKAPKGLLGTGFRVGRRQDRLWLLSLGFKDPPNPDHFLRLAVTQTPSWGPARSKYERSPGEHVLDRRGVDGGPPQQFPGDPRDCPPHRTALVQWEALLKGPRQQRLLNLKPTPESLSPPPAPTRCLPGGLRTPKWHFVSVLSLPATHLPRHTSDAGVLELRPVTLPCLKGNEIGF